MIDRHWHDRPVPRFGKALSALIILLLAVVSRLPAASTPPSPRFVQDRFAIGFWVSPQTDDDLDARYAEIAEANFTFVIGLCGAKNPPPAVEQLKMCEKHGLKALVHLDRQDLNALPDGPACWGYSIVDEPDASRFPALRKAVDALRQARPGRLGYINLFPNYANAGQLGTPTYDEHVSRFIREVQPDVLSMDHYPIFRPGGDGRDNYCRNLEVMRRESIAGGIPFWNFFNSMPYGPHTDPTEAQLRWQIFTALAYGAKGLMYFCYWTPRGAEFPKGGAILTADGRRTRHYDEARRLNARLKNLGPTLMQLTNTAVRRVKPGPTGTNATAEFLAGSGVRSIQDDHGEFLIGTFRHVDGRRAVLLSNYHFAYSAWPTVAFAAEATDVIEIDQRTGRATRVIDDSPDLPGLQLSLDAGEGRLFLFPSEPPPPSRSTERSP